jgi:hypothetical protein
MNLSRREVLAGMGSMAAWSANPAVHSRAFPFVTDSPRGAATLPAKSDFSIPDLEPAHGHGRSCGRWYESPRHRASEKSIH